MIVDGVAAAESAVNIIHLSVIKDIVAVMVMAIGVNLLITSFQKCLNPELIKMTTTMLVLVGLSILMFFACVAITKGVVKLTKKMMLKLKSAFIRKEA